MTRGSKRERQLFCAIVLVLLLWGAISAYSWCWTTDDAFISFRYARNLVEGRGLVFNAGQHVEGYSNFLWTLWVAVGIRLGVAAESWANLWGGLCYLVALLLLALNHRRLDSMDGATPWLLPIAALGGACHRDWGIFATGGLETSLFTLLLVALFMLVVWSPTRPGRLALAGLVAGLAALTRPDGALPAAVCGLFLLWSASRRWKGSLLYASAFAAIWLPFLVWRVSYYGELLPNTYYAKSADLTWYTQGWHYLTLFFEKYWALLLSPLLLLVPSPFRSGESDGSGSMLRRQAILAALLTVGYGWFVARVGGDFMYARMLIPVTPFLLLLLELGLRRFLGARPTWGYALGGVLCVTMIMTPPPVGGANWSRGVADERAYYSEERVAGLDRSATVLRRYFEGLPVRVAFYGDEARIVYKARFSDAIESHAGLTEPEVARQPLEKRGRVGHEKHASADFLIHRRKAQLTFSKEAGRLLKLDRLIPMVAVKFDDEVYGQLLYWDPELIAELRRRGAQLPDFMLQLDRLIADLERTPDDQVRRIYERLQRFYFDHVSDPGREGAFLRRLAER